MIVAPENVDRSEGIYMDNWILERSCFWANHSVRDGESCISKRKFIFLIRFSSACVASLVVNVSCTWVLVVLNFSTKFKSINLSSLIR